MKIKSLPPRSFYYTRHGQTDWNKERKLMGQQDIPLNEEGMRQAQQLAQHVKTLEISLIVASPLIRAQQTAKIIADACGKSIVTIQEFKEAFGGTLEGNPRGGDELIEYWRLGGYLATGAEPWHMFVERIHSALHNALSIEHPKPILIVAHGAVYWAIQEILKLEEQALGNCAIALHEPTQEDDWKREFITDFYRSN